VLNLFLALLLSSFGAESFQHSQEDSEPNKLQEAADRINRAVNYIRLHFIAFWSEMQRHRKRAHLQFNVGDSAVGTSFDAKLCPASLLGPAVEVSASADTGAVNYNGPSVVVDLQPAGRVFFCDLCSPSPFHSTFSRFALRSRSICFLRLPLT